MNLEPQTTESDVLDAGVAWSMRNVLQTVVSEGIGSYARVSGANVGGKTGTTSDAGSCLALLSQNAYGDPYISIVLHAANKTNLYTYMNQLLSAINQ